MVLFMEPELLETQTLLLSLPRPILQKAQVIAKRRNASLPDLLIQLLTTLIEQDDHQYELARQRSLATLEQGYNLGFADKITWSRDELHER